MDKQRSASGKQIALWGVFLFCLAAVGLLGWFFHYAEKSAAGMTDETVVLVIPRGSGVKEINTILAAAGLVQEDSRFIFLARYLGLSHTLQAGEFALHRGQNPEQLLRELAQAKPIQHAITISEGLTVEQIGGIFSKGGWCDVKEFVRLAESVDFLSTLGLSQYATLEGYLYPDTYYLTRKGQDTADILRMMVKHYFTVWEQLEVPEKYEYSPREVLILASMVEKEAGRAEERPLIAGVFLNRLRRGMRLQSDPTVIYGIKNFSGRLSKKNLRTPSPYNTYIIKRLPATPICNPGEDALAAVLWPVKSAYLYFVSKRNGRHYFSKTLREHNRAVQKYLRSSKKN